MAERRDESFESGGERCAAWVYPAEGGADRAPVVVLAHGFAGTREARLGAYAERFAAAGICAVVFDYRYFGDSTGEPRDLLSVPRQQEDWRAAIAFARSLDGVDPSRLALWGSSYSGGHVVAVAAGRTDVTAIVSQAPFADGLATLLQAGPANAARLTVAGLRDLAQAAVGAEPYRIPAVGGPGELAAMNQPGASEGYHALFDDPAGFRNQFCARGGLEIAPYSPLRKAKGVRCPALVVTVTADSVTPAAAAVKMAKRMPLGRHIPYEGDHSHFDIYVGELFERTIVDQTAFLAEQLGV